MKGELEYWGGSCFSGYYKNPDRTAEVVYQDGWVKSGDIVEVLPNGSIKIVDRVRNTF